ncbi:MAG: SpoIIE family protein phosphatase [Treponema sp.]|nr:SpoIIE family protein phosphatase [Treponema sp.]
MVLLTNCNEEGKSHNKPYRQYLTDSIEYVETPPDYNYVDIISHRLRFKKLEKKEMRNLTNLLRNKKNLIWLKIDFTIDNKLFGHDLGLYIGHLRSASTVYLNGNFIKKYGDHPPAETTAGYVTHNYIFTDALVNKQGKNTIFIQVWPGAWGTISEDIYISDQEEVIRRAERKTFFNSRITITFTMVSLILSFLYVILYFLLKQYKENRMYLFYALLNFYTSHFLLAFSYGDMPWLNIPFISYLTVLKFTWCYGGLSTIYFSASFTLSYLGYEATTKEMIQRMVLLIATIVIAIAMPNYIIFIKVSHWLTVVGLMQFAYVIPRVIKSFASPYSRAKTKKLLIGFTPIFIGLFLDLLLHIIYKLPDLPLFCLYGWQFTSYMFLYQLIKQFSEIYVHNTKLKDQLQEFNQNLEQVVTIRTKELSDANYVLSKGLETVSHVQKNFLPPKEHTFRGWDLAIYYKPLDNNVSGDLYDYYTSNSDTCLDGLGIFDVSGHGIPAGLMTILAKGIISQQFISGIQQQESMSEILEEINRTYIKEKVNIDNYITGLLFRFSEFNKKDICSVEFANAGHPYPILYDSGSDEVREIKIEEPDKQYGIIGVEGLDVSFPPISFRMKSDDIILCYTDGLTDATNYKKENFSKKLLMDILKEAKDKTAAEILNYLMEKFKLFTMHESLNDDITVIVLKRNNSKEYIQEI